MTSDHWKRVRGIFEAVIERPDEERAAFIVSASEGDDAVRRDVEALLAADTRDADVLDGVQQARLAALADFARDADGREGARVEPSILAPHTHLGAYEILELIGAGGMGEVYRARDTRLDRAVAIKVLPPLLAFEPDRLARFRREAQMLAAMNHPNIAAIYGLEDSGRVPALVLELVDGPTLADRLARRALPLDEAIRIGAQIAEAIEAAHDKGIVHRDLKPSNIKIDASGTVKVLDFGLAKEIVAEGERPDLTASRAGLILGTASYMSPEQARGQSVEKRSDIWAFGCVLYEMLTGRLAFPGATASDAIARILEREPDWSALPAATPPRIRRLLGRCLAKDPRRRLKDIGDVKLDLAGDDEAIAIPSQRRVVLPWIAVAALAAALIASLVLRPRVASTDLSVTPLDLMATARFSRFTDWDGHEGGADISPDGRFVTFIADRDGEFDLWSVQVGTSDFRNLTAGFPPLGPPHRLIRNFGFVGDGSQIWFSVAGDPVLSRKMTVPVSGGTPRPFLPDGLAAPAWSSDGMRLVYFNNALNDALFVADRSAGDPRAVPIETSDLWTGGVARTHSHNMVWSPDDQWLYFTHGSTRALNWTDDMDVWRVRPSGGTPERLTHHDTAVTFLAPIDGRTLIYVACDQDGSGPWLWSLDVVTKITRRITWSIDQYTSVAASRDGKHIVATVVSPTANLWSVPILDRPAEDRDVRRYQVPTVRALAPRFGGNALFYLSSRGAADGLFRFQDGQAIELRKGADGAMFDPPAVSRDGSQVAVVHAKEQRRRLAVLAADGTGFHGLAESLDVQGTIDWSPDGAWIVAGGTDDVQGQGLFKIPVGGGLPVRLVAGRAVNPVWSADGDLIVYAGPLVTGQFAPLVAIRPDNGMAVELPPLQVRPGGHRFLPDGSGLVYLPRTESLDFWLLDLKTRRPRQLTHLVDQGRQSTFEISPAFDITPDGKSIVFDRAREQSDIVLIDLTGK